MIQINFESDIPVYSQLADQIRKEIQANHMEPGTMLPSDREYCSMLNISHMTLKKAMEILVSDGLITRKKGVGTFVSPPKIKQELFSLSGFTGDNSGEEHSVSSKVLEFTIGPCDPEIVSRLGLTPETPVVVLERVRMINDEPVALEKAYLHCPDGQPEKLTAYDFGRESLYRVLRKDFGIQLGYAQETIEIAYGSRRESQYLSCSIDTPMFKLERTSYDTQGRAVELVQSFYRADKYIFSATLIAPQSGSKQ